MIEDQLVNYGILGIWTLTLLYDKYNIQKRFLTVIENNTKELSYLRQTIKSLNK